MLAGVDISSLEETEKKGGRFFDKGVRVDALECLVFYGADAARLRLWLDPYGEDKTAYEGGTCDIECVTRLAKRAKNLGMKLLLDIHYSDFWCDPQRQLIPKSWRGLSTQQLCKSVYDYTAGIIRQMESSGVVPEMVQVGNEITNGFLWPNGRLTGDGERRGFDNLASLLRSGLRAVKDSSDAKTVLHLESSCNTELWQNRLDNIFDRGVDCDILGASYYPYWHGDMYRLHENLNNCIRRYDKDILVVETSYPFTTEHYAPGAGETKLCISSDVCADGKKAPFELSPKGQRKFLQSIKKLVSSLDRGRGLGFFWWEPAWIPANATRWASESALEYCGEQGKNTGNEWSNQCLFDYGGNALPALRDFGKIE